MSKLLSLALLGLMAANSCLAADEKDTVKEVREAFAKFAIAIKEDNFNQAKQSIAPPADAVWSNFITALNAARKYENAMDQRFGKGNEEKILGPISNPGGFAECFFEGLGEIHEVKELGKGKAQVRVWTKRSEERNPSETAIYERAFTAVKLDNQWKFQLNTSFATGAPIVKKVQRKAEDGKVVEVYAEHSMGNSISRSALVEKPPISYEGKEEGLKREADQWGKVAVEVDKYTEQVKQGAWASRQEATKALERAVFKLMH